ncbi:thiamine diphosphokinase [Priestia endophytica]|uniref:thiamine diphosphokinase n=1 Tax=Priestia endophytica TaxID=135735 RepID=UPI00203D13F7|nr:thiamine diphosphokinase [Priestia endophytica]MCM3539324.1 thiamine diphosphokinase [Priestia endophytica]
MKINILAGAPQSTIPPLQDGETKWIGVDRGVYTLMEQGIMPIQAFGDFDSLTELELKHIQDVFPELKVYPAEKDETDLEIAINWALNREIEEIDIYGATGGRLDHMFGGISLIYKALQKNVRVRLIDKQNTLTMYKEGTYNIKAHSLYKYISFVPFSLEVENLTLKGFKYPLHKRCVPVGSTLCISNELIQQNGTFSFTKGILMMIRSND